MPGKYQYDIELKSNVAKLLTDMKEVQDRLDTVEGKEYKIKLNVDEKKLSNVISNLEKMLDSLGKGTGDFKQFENLSKELSSIVSEVQNLSKAFGKVDDSGTKTLLSSIQNIDKSLSELSQHIINVNKNMSNIGGDTNSTVKQVENISNVYDNAAKSAEKLADAQSKIENKSNISSGTQIKDVFQGDKIDQATTSAKELDKILEQVDIPTDSFDDVLSKLDLTESKLKEIVKITKQSVSDSEGKFHDSYTLKDKRGSTEIYGLSSNTEKGQLLRSNIVGYDAKAEAQESKRLAEENIRLNKAYYDSKKQEEVEYQRLRAKYLAEGKAQEEKIVKDAWDKNVKAIQDYMDAVTKLNNLNAKDKGTGKYSSQIALQEKNVEELKEKALEARTAITSMINPHDVSLNTWRDYLDVMEKFSQASLGSAESVAKLEDALRKMDFSSLESASTKFDSQYNNLSIKPDGDHQFLSWTNDLNELNTKIDEYNSKVKYLKENNIVDGEQVVEVKNLRDEIEQTINVMTKTPQAKRGWTDIGASKAAEKVANVLKQNTKMSKEAKDAIRAYYNELRSGNPSQPIDEILVKVNQLVQKERELGRVGKSFGEIFKEKVIYGGAAQLAGMVGFYDVINVGREGFNVIKELDTALVDLKKTTAMNSSQLEEFYFDSNDVAKQMGVTTQAIIDQASAWSRLGYNTKEQSTQMAKLSSQFATISPGMDTDTAQEGLISIMKAWNIDVDDVKSEIMDNINALGNGMAENNQDIVEGMERSAAALASVGTSYEDAFAMFSGIQEVLQNAEVSGRALRSISMRIRGYDESIEELSSDLENITGELIDLTKTAEHTQGVSIFKEGSTTEFKSLVDYFGEINKVWDEMSQKQQNDFLQKAFGKTQAQAGAALIQNYQGVTKSLEIMENAAGSADREMSIVESSIDYKLNKLQQTWVGTVQNLVDRGDIGAIIDAFTSLSEAIGWVVDNLGLLGTTAIIGTGAFGINKFVKDFA